VATNPFDSAFSHFVEPEPKRRSAPGCERPAAARAAPAIKITEAGAYADIPAEDYHGVEICPGPSISASGLKLIEEKPASLLAAVAAQPGSTAPGRQAPLRDRPRAARPAAARRASARQIITSRPTASRRAPSQMGRADPAYEAAVAEAKTILSASEFAWSQAMAESVSKHELAGALLTAGQPEMTLACPGPEDRPLDPGPPRCPARRRWRSSRT
jgi:hypothetical protein